MLESSRTTNLFQKPFFLFWAFGLVILALIIRFPKLTLLPVFHDEAFYIHWAQIISDNPTDLNSLFISKVNGKQPLSFWLLALVIDRFDDPLFAERIFAVLFGAGSTLGIILMGRKLFGVQTALLGGLLYVFLPYAVF